MGETFMSRPETKLEPSPLGLSREAVVHMAKIAEDADRHEDMMRYTKQILKLVENGDDVTDEERNLISISYKNVMSARRSAVRTASQMIQCIESEPVIVDHPDWESGFHDAGSEFKTKNANELYDLIHEVSQEIVAFFTKGPQAAKKSEVLVFFYKMDGDYNRYGAESSSEDQMKAFIGKATEAYTKAVEISQAEPEPLKTTNPIRLGLALNYSVFLYEILGQKEEAKKLADEAFNSAIEQLDQVEEDEYKDATLIMQLLKDNLNLWTGEDGEQ